MKKYKTSEKNRSKYIYYSVDGTLIEILPGKNNVAERDIEILHSMDDNAVDEKRRYDYRVAINLNFYFEEKDISDCNKYLMDNSANPLNILIEIEEEKEHDYKLKKLRDAINNLRPNQRNLIKWKYEEMRTNTNIAMKENVTEAAIRNRLTKINNKLQKSFA